MRKKLPVSAKVRKALALAFPSAGKSILDLQVVIVYEKAYLLAPATDDQVVTAAQALTWSAQRIKDLQSALTAGNQTETDRQQTELELNCRIAFMGDRRASDLLIKSKRGERLGISDSAYLNRMRKRKALYGVHGHPMESPDVATAQELAETERSARQCLRLPDDLPDDRLIQVLEDYASLSQDKFWLTDSEERNSRGMKPESRARAKAVRMISGDEHAVNLYARRYLGETLSADENSYLDAELSR